MDLRKIFNNVMIVRLFFVVLSILFVGIFFAGCGDNEELPNTIKEVSVDVDINEDNSTGSALESGDSSSELYKANKPTAAFNTGVKNAQTTDGVKSLFNNSLFTTKKDGDYIKEVTNYEGAELTVTSLNGEFSNVLVKTNDALVLCKIIKNYIRRDLTQEEQAEIKTALTKEATTVNTIADTAYVYIVKDGDSYLATII